MQSGGTVFYILRKNRSVCLVECTLFNWNSRETLAERCAAATVQRTVPASLRRRQTLPANL